MSFELHHFQTLQQPSEVGIVLPTFTGEIIKPEKLTYLRTHSQLRLNPVANHRFNRFWQSHFPILHWDLPKSSNKSIIGVLRKEHCFCLERIKEWNSVTGIGRTGEIKMYGNKEGRNKILQGKKTQAVSWKTCLCLSLCHSPRSVPLEVLGEHHHEDSILREEEPVLGEAMGWLGCWFSH